MKLNKFLEGIFSLIISQILIKIFGVIYSLYLTNKTGFGDQGNAIYMSVKCLSIPICSGKHFPVLLGKI